jgi:membrane-bound metal-dependent hydrolase YbcI (DUF457 family)
MIQKTVEVGGYSSSFIIVLITILSSSSPGLPSCLGLLSPVLPSGHRSMTVSLNGKASFFLSALIWLTCGSTNDVVVET